jgi:hypothetical protein
MGFLQEVRKFVSETDAVWDLHMSLKANQTSRGLFRPFFKAIDREPELIIRSTKERERIIREFDKRIEKVKKID